MKVVLITGASSGFGKSIAVHLASLGHTVFGTSRSQKESFAGVTMLPLDVTDDESVHELVKQVIAQAGKIDVLINNAGVGLCGSIEDTSIEEARWQMETNFFGPVRMVKAVLPHMREQGAGRIIKIGSLAGQLALPYQPFYSTSKFAIAGFNEVLRLELAGSGIDSTMIEPGDFATGFTAARVFSEQAKSGLHAEQLERVVGIYERDEIGGASPQLLAKLCARIIESKKVQPRYSVGRMDQRFGLLLKRWIPHSWMEKLMLYIYQIK
jgi:NAD(P)-dependent dehydrogenase (short-subunit alcohol dehydrogenase family)